MAFPLYETYSERELDEDETAAIIEASGIDFPVTCFECSMEMDDGETIESIIALTEHALDGLTARDYFLHEIAGMLAARVEWNADELTG